MDLPVLRPAGSITAFQHHVTRSLRRFNVESLVFILLLVQCSLVLRPWIFLRCSVFILLLVFCSLICRPWISLCVQSSYSVLFGSSPCWLDHCVSTPCDSITAAVLITISLWFFALLARSLRFNTMRLDHCGGSTALWFFTLGSFSASYSSVFLFSALWFFALLARSLRYSTL